MNREIPVHNPGKTTMYVGGCAIPPGETRILSADLVPAHLVAPKAPKPVINEPSVDEVLGAMLKGTVADVRAGLALASDEQLTRLAELEDKANGGAGRKGVAEAIAEEQLMRASRAHLAEFAASLAGLDEDALLDLMDEHKNDLDKAELVQAALDALNPGDGDGQSSTD